MKTTVLVLVALVAGCGDGSDDPGNIRGQAGEAGAAGSAGGAGGALGSGGSVSSTGGHDGAAGAGGLGAAGGSVGGMTGAGGVVSTGGTGAGGSVGSIAVCDPATGYQITSGLCYDNAGQLQHHAGMTCVMCGSLLGPGQFCRNGNGNLCVRLCSDCT